ncbi:MAG: hypothetical protein JW925_14105 [Syntrophaceae bacterium]|nr:hypothetical protein [Syntrophaceae bacterium]
MKQVLKIEKQIGFRFRDIQSSECSFQQPENAIVKDQTFGFSFTFGVHFDQSKHEIRIEIGATIYLSPKQKIIIGKTTNSFCFEIVNFDDFIIDKDKYSFPEDFIIMLMNISFSTLRGMIFEKSVSIIQSKVILPIINIKEIVKKQ